MVNVALLAIWLGLVVAINREHKKISVVGVCTSLPTTPHLVVGRSACRVGVRPSLNRSWPNGRVLLYKPVEELSPVTRASSIESKRILIQVIVQVFTAHSALVRPDQPALQQGSHPVNVGQQLGGRLARRRAACESSLADRPRFLVGTLFLRARFRPPGSLASRVLATQQREGW